MRIAVGPSLDPTESPLQAPLDNEVWMVSKQEARNAHTSRASLNGGSPTWARTRDLRINSPAVELGCKPRQCLGFT
jgi:hypothetical protein